MLLGDRKKNGFFMEETLFVGFSPSREQLFAEFYENIIFSPKAFV